MKRDSNDTAIRDVGKDEIEELRTRLKASFLYSRTKLRILGRHCTYSGTEDAIAAMIEKLNLIEDDVMAQLGDESTSFVAKIDKALEQEEFVHGNDQRMNP